MGAHMRPPSTDCRRSTWTIVLVHEGCAALLAMQTPDVRPCWAAERSFCRGLLACNLLQEAVP